jgi:predicted CopG family antitoxin
MPTINLTQDAYNALQAANRPDETLSETIHRLTNEPSLLELAGTLDDDQAQALRDAIQERRDRRMDGLDSRDN